jgi:multidrug resistance efflux pump
MGWPVRRSQTWHHRCRGRSLRQVHTGDVLYVIEKFDFEVALDNAKATILNREADLAVKKAQNARRAALTTLSTSIEGKQVFDGNAKMAEAAYASAKAAQPRYGLPSTAMSQTF